MNKVLIEINIPALKEHFDIFLPVDIQIGILSEVIADGVAEITDGRYVVSKCEQICMDEPIGLLCPTLTLQDYGAKDGMKLYLI